MKPDKNYDTGLRILEVLKILLENDMSKSDLIAKLQDNPLFENVYTPEAFIKYFNTLEVLGFKIEKYKNVYRLKNSFSDIKLTDEELKVYVNLIRYLKKLHNKNIENSLREIFYKTVKYFNEEQQSTILNAINEKEIPSFSKTDNLTDYLESLMYDNMKISVTYIKNNLNQDTVKVELKEILEKKDDIILVCYDDIKRKNKKIPVSSIVSIKQLPQRAKNQEYLNTVIFRLYGRLTSAYKLKKSEKLIDFDISAGYVTISNSEEDKDALIKRLLKYGENCRIIKPQHVIDDFIFLTDNIIKNLEEDSF